MVVCGGVWWCVVMCGAVCGGVWCFSLLPLPNRVLVLRVVLFLGAALLALFFVCPLLLSVLVCNTGGAAAVLVSWGCFALLSFAALPLCSCLFGCLCLEGPRGPGPPRADVQSLFRRRAHQTSKPAVPGAPGNDES